MSSCKRWTLVHWLSKAELSYPELPFLCIFGESGPQYWLWGDWEGRVKEQPLCNSPMRLLIFRSPHWHETGWAHGCATPPDPPSASLAPGPGMCVSLCNESPGILWATHTNFRGKKNWAGCACPCGASSAMDPGSLLICPLYIPLPFPTHRLPSLLQAPASDAKTTDLQRLPSQAPQLCEVKSSQWIPFSPSLSEWLGSTDGALAHIISKPLLSSTMWLKPTIAVGVRGGQCNKTHAKGFSPSFS